MNFFSLFKRKLIYTLKKKISVDYDSYQGNSLDDLFFHYGSDKANIFKKKNQQGHGFSRFYENKFRFLKNEKINILEIGSFAGASAVAFIKYLSNSKVFCFDINISNFKYSSKKIEVYGLDINDKTKVLKVLNEIFEKHKFEKFDFIIDDGSHYLSDILFSLNFFFKYLKKGGTYVIEDFKHPNYYQYNKNVDDILVDDLLENIKRKKLFKSSFFNEENQTYLFKSIRKIETYKGNLKDSDICFIEKEN